MAGPNDTFMYNILDLEMDVPTWLNERMMMSLIPLEVPLWLGSMLLFCIIFITYYALEVTFVAV